MSTSTSAFIRSLKHPFKFRMFLLSRLPNAFFAGVRIRNIDENRCEVTVPFKWFTKNPFRSTYFACLSMAAEMSTGILAMGNIYQRLPKISMLVVSVEGNFFKKAKGITKFVCEDGKVIEQTVQQAIDTG